VALAQGSRGNNDLMCERFVRQRRTEIEIGVKLAIKVEYVFTNNCKIQRMSFL